MLSGEMKIKEIWVWLSQNDLLDVWQDEFSRYSIDEKVFPFV